MSEATVSFSDLLNPPDQDGWWQSREPSPAVRREPSVESRVHAPDWLRDCCAQVALSVDVSRWHFPLRFELSKTHGGNDLLVRCFSTFPDLSRPGKQFQASSCTTLSSQGLEERRSDEERVEMILNAIHRLFVERLRHEMNEVFWVRGKRRQNDHEMWKDGLAQ